MFKHTLCLPAVFKFCFCFDEAIGFNTLFGQKVGSNVCSIPADFVIFKIHYLDKKSKHV